MKMSVSDQEGPPTLKYKRALEDIRLALQEKGKSRDQEPLTEQVVLDKESDRLLKRIYAKWFIGILIGQLLVMNLIMILHGSKVLEFTEWALNLYVTATIAEVFGVVLVITKNLFPNRKN